MPKIRIHELAKELNIDNKKVMEYLKEKKIEVKSHMSTLEENQEAMVRKAFSSQPEKKEERKNQISYRCSVPRTPQVKKQKITGVRVRIHAPQAAGRQAESVRFRKRRKAGRQELQQASRQRQPVPR